MSLCWWGRETVVLASRGRNGAARQWSIKQGHSALTGTRSTSWDHSHSFGVCGRWKKYHDARIGLSKMSIVEPRSFSFCVLRESELVDLSGFYRWTASIMVRDLFASHGYQWTNRNEKFQNGSFTFLVEKEKQSKAKKSSETRDKESGCWSNIFGETGKNLEDIFARLPSPIVEARKILWGLSLWDENASWRVSDVRTIHRNLRPDTHFNLPKPKLLTPSADQFVHGHP